MRKGERQVATDLADIRADHLARYEWAGSLIGGGSVLDVGAGIGYGKAFFPDRKVTSVEIDEGAIAWGKRHFGATYERRDLNAESCFIDIPPHRYATAFEVIEHLPNPQLMLERIPARYLFASAPDERVFPYNNRIAYHHRHYTPDELCDLLHRSGWQVTEVHGQRGPESPVEQGVMGRTVVVRAERIRKAIKSKPDRGDLVTYVSGERNAHHHLGAWA